MLKPAHCRTRDVIKVTRDLPLSGIQTRLVTRARHTVGFVTNPACDWYKLFFAALLFQKTYIQNTHFPSLEWVMTLLAAGAQVSITSKYRGTSLLRNRPPPLGPP